MLDHKGLDTKPLIKDTGSPSPMMNYSEISQKKDRYLSISSASYECIKILLNSTFMAAKDHAKAKRILSLSTMCGVCLILSALI